MWSQNRLLSFLLPMPYPKITIITPSFNQGQFLEETIISVIGQNYPNLEYFIMDGGSSDNSVEIIKKYERHITYWVSEKDGGQSAAINKGFNRATGSILGWLNSDDMYLPGALRYIAARLRVNQPELIFGNCIHFVDQTPRTWGSDVVANHERFDLTLCDYIIQPSCFWTQEAWHLTGLLDESFNFGFDWDWFIRAMKKSVNLRTDNKYLSMYRIHNTHKSGVGGMKRAVELAAIYKKHAGQGYDELFLRCYQHRSKLLFMRNLLQRYRLNKYEAEIFKVVCPLLFAGFDKNKVHNLAWMI